MDQSKSLSALESSSLAEYLASLPGNQQREAISGLTETEARSLLYDWRGFYARPNQLRPLGQWRYWLVQAGRGFGKTRTGAECVREWVAEGKRRIALVGPTAHDTRKVMVEGESGLVTISPPWDRPEYNPSLREIRWKNGALATLYTADEPERLRGPQHDCAWCDELAAWRFPEAWDNLLFGLRLGDDPRAVITTTPKPTKLMRELVADPNTHVTRGSSYDNRANLAPAFFEAIIKKYEGTRLGRQELMAELLEDLPGALWTRAIIDNNRVRGVPSPLQRIVVAIDPAVTSGEESDETGIIVAGVHDNGHVYIIADRSLRGTPGEWATEALRAWLWAKGDRIIAEVNNGGDLVEANIRAVVAGMHGQAAAAMVPFRAVRASRGKMVRAEPVASLYEQGRVHHIGSFGQLEDQMCSYVPGVEKSPDRMDALVWAVTDLVVQPIEERMTIAYHDPYEISPY
jgi:phage terminase large subunit-like protein